jgi:hypothetical protein
MALVEAIQGWGATTGVGAPWPAIGDLIGEGREGEGEGHGWGRRGWLQEGDWPGLFSGSVLLFYEEEENSCMR